MSKSKKSKTVEQRADEVLEPQVWPDDAPESEGDEGEEKVDRNDVMQHIFMTVEEADARAAEMNKTAKHKRSVFKATSGDKTVYIVAQLLSRARNHAARYFNLDVVLAHAPQRVPAVRKTLEEQIAEMSAEELAKVQAILAGKLGLTPQ